MKVSVQCPKCEKSYYVDEEKLGSSALCSQCSHTFTLGVSADETAQPQAKSPSAPREEGPVPKTIGHYQVEKQIGAGAMGEVYLAHDPELDRDVRRIQHSGESQAGRRGAPIEGDF